MILAALVVSPLFLLVGLVSLVFAIVVVVDMARRPGWQWAQAGSNKTLWLVLEIVCVLLFGFISIIVGVLYFTIARPKLLAVERQGGGPGWPQGPGTGWSQGPGTGWPASQPPAGQPPSWTTGAYPPPVSGTPVGEAEPGTTPPSNPGSGASSFPGSGPPPNPQSEPPPSYPGSGPPPYPGSGPPVGPGSGPPVGPAGGGAPGYPSGPPAYPSAPPPSTEPSSAPPFGWYPDPSGHHEKRYWDGTRWTENVSDGDERSTEPLPD